MKCRKCGHSQPKGRPKKLDDAKVKKMRRDGWTLSSIAWQYGTSIAAVHYSLKRSK